MTGISKPPKHMDIEDRELEAEIMFDIILTARQLGQAYYTDDYGALTTEDLALVGRIVASGKSLNDMYDTYLPAPERGKVAQPDLPAPERAVDDAWKEGLA